MATVNDYPEIIKQVIRGYAAFKPSFGDVVVETVFDDQSGHYELIHSGWNGYRRIHGAVLHVDLRGDKVWIQHDGTESGIAEELVSAGIPRDHLVLAWHHPDERKHTPFAVG
jgi:hypothetical protein